MCEIKQIKEIAEILADAAHKACEDIPFAPANLDAPCTHATIECRLCKEARALIAQGYIRKTESTVEVVRCKDCTKGHKKFLKHQEVVECQLHHHDDPRQYKDPMHYCGHGTRREE